MGIGTVARVVAREQQLGRKVSKDDLEPIIWNRYQSARVYSAEQLDTARRGLERAAQQMALLQQQYDVRKRP